MSAPRCLASVILAFPVACEDTGSMQSPYYEGDSLEVWASEDLEACNGTFPYMESWLSAFRARVGRSDSSVRHTLYWLSPEEFEVSPCTMAEACAFPLSDVIYSSVIPAEHELVHTELEAWPPSLIREGAAEVFGCMDHFDLGSSSSIGSLADERQILRPDYQTAGRFSRLLIDRFGLDAYLLLYAELDGVEGLEGLAAGVADVLGVELPSLIQDFEARPRCDLEAWRFYDVECSVLPLEPWQDPDHWSTTVNLACESPEVIGPRDGVVWSARALHVEETDHYEMSIEGTDSSAVATIFSCAAACAREGPTVVMIPVATVARPTTLVLDAGRHWLRIEQASDTGTSVTVRIER